MCLTLHLDNKRFLCLFVKFVLYRGPVLCEKHRIFFFFFIRRVRLSLSLRHRVNVKGSNVNPGWFAFYSAPEGLTSHHQMPCRTSSRRRIASQRHSPRRIAKRLIKAGFLHWQRNFVTRFLNQWASRRACRCPYNKLTPNQLCRFKAVCKYAHHPVFLWEWAYWKTSLNLYNNL